MGLSSSKKDSKEETKAAASRPERPTDAAVDKKASQDENKKVSDVTVERKVTEKESIIAVAVERNDTEKESKTDSSKPGNFRETVIYSKKKSALLVAAIDFGTTYSGYAYAFLAKPNEILANCWDETAAVKTPTIVLMNPKQEFVAFGEEARKQYQSLVNQDAHRDWYFLERFKMKLFVRDTPLDEEMQIEDILGKKINAMKVFTASIKYMKEHLLKVLNDPNRPENVKIEKDTDIRWVLTVPAIWDDLSKRFMRDAAEAAGIQTDMLYLALEPEAASLYCKRELGVNKVPSGTKFIVLDLGGGTADITCHEVSKDGTLRELHPPTGGDFGGTMVDNVFLQLLRKIFGAPLLKKYKNDNLSEFLEFMADFEIKKRKFDGTGRVNLKFPAGIRERYQAYSGMSVQESMEESTLSGKLEFRADKLIISEDQMKGLFDSAIDSIIETTNTLLETIAGIDIIILAGGFSESPYLQKKMQEHFQNVIVCPNEPSAAVIKGAVTYGHNPRAISSRKCKYTYGIARMEKFIKEKHPEAKKREMGNFTFCDDVFCKHIEIGTEVNVELAEKSVEKEYYPPTGDVRQAVLEVYKSTKKNPMFVTDPDCEMVGLIKIDIDPHGDVWSKLLVKLVFGGTELLVQVRDVKNKHVMKGWVDFHG